jgi:hypothetical protein
MTMCHAQLRVDGVVSSASSSKNIEGGLYAALIDQLAESFG